MSKYADIIETRLARGPFRIYTPASLGDAIRHYRTEAGMTQAQLAAKALGRSYLSELETRQGDRAIEAAPPRTERAGRSNDVGQGGLVVADELAVWLYGERVAVIDRERGRPRLAYTEEALDDIRWASRCCRCRSPSGTADNPRASSARSSTVCSPKENRGSQSPETSASPRRHLRVDSALGRDCAGAVVIQPADDPPLPTDHPTAEPLSPMRSKRSSGTSAAHPSVGRTGTSLAGRRPGEARPDADARRLVGPTC